MSQNDSQSDSAAQSETDADADADGGYQEHTHGLVFAEELRDATQIVSSGDSDQAPNYAVFPTGARHGRVYVAGTLMEVIEDEYRVRFRINGPTGTFWGSASKEYDAEVANFLLRAQEQEDGIPQWVGCTATPNVFETDDGDELVSLDPNEMFSLDKPTVNQWILQAARATAERIVGERGSSQSRAFASKFYGTSPEDYADLPIRALEELDDRVPDEAEVEAEAEADAEPAAAD